MNVCPLCKHETIEKGAADEVLDYCEMCETIVAPLHWNEHNKEGQDDDPVYEVK